MITPAQQPKRYRAFISYSQLDKKWARKLHQALESYRVPLGVVAEVNSKSRRIGRIFRDEDEMSASASLGAALEGALDDSETLIVICSPNSARSEWVDMEVRRFKRNPAATILAVIVSGTPNSGDLNTECFCPALRFKVDQEGELTDIPDEPLAPDLAKDGLRKLTSRLVAGILGVSFDELWNREKRRRNANMLKTATISIALLLATTLWGGSYLREQNNQQAIQTANFARHAMRDAMTSQLETDRASGFERGLRFAVLASRSSILHPELPLARALLRFGAQRLRTLALMSGHRGGVQHAGFAMDDKHVVSWGEDNYLRVWLSENGELVSETPIDGTILGSDASVSRIMISGTDRLELWHSSDNKVAVLAEGLQASRDLVAFDAAGKRAATAASELGRVDLWDTQTGLSIGSIDNGNAEALGAISLSQDGELLAIASLDDTLKLWRIDTGELVMQQQSKVSRRHRLTFSPDDTVLVSRYRDDNYLYSIENQELLGIIEDTLEFSPDGSVLAVSNEDYEIELRNASDAELIATLRGHQKPINSFRFGIDGKLLVSASQDTTVRLWSIEQATQLAMLEGHTGAVKSASLAADNSRILSFAEDDRIRIFAATTTGQDAVAINAFGDEVHQPRRIRFDSSNERVITAGLDKRAIIWDTASGAMLQTIKGKKYGVDEVAFSTDGTRAMATGVDGSAAIADVTSGKELSAFPVSQRTVDDRLLFVTSANPSLSRIITPGDSGQANVWDAESNTVITRLVPEAEQFYAFYINQDGNRAVSLSWEGTTRVWDTRTGKKITTLRGHAGLIETADFSVDGSIIATAGQDKSASVWDATSGDELFRIDGFDDSVLRVVFSNNGQLLAISSTDGSVRLWDVSQQRELLRMSGHDDGANMLKFDASDQFLVSGGWDRKVRIWEVASGLELAMIDLRSADLADIDVSPGAERVAIADLSGPARVWEVSHDENQTVDGTNKDNKWWRQQICRADNGRLSAPMRILSREDILVAPILEGLEGQDVCALTGSY